MITTENAVKRGKKGSEGVEVKSGDLVLVEWTATSRYHNKGDESVLHKIAAEKMIKSGKAKKVKDLEGGELRARQKK